MCYSVFATLFIQWTAISDKNQRSAFFLHNLPPDDAIQRGRFALFVIDHVVMRLKWEPEASYDSQSSSLPRDIRCKLVDRAYRVLSIKYVNMLVESILTRLVIFLRLLFTIS